MGVSNLYPATFGEEKGSVLSEYIDELNGSEVNLDYLSLITLNKVDLKNIYALPRNRVVGAI